MEDLKTKVRENQSQVYCLTQYLKYDSNGIGQKNLDKFEVYIKRLESAKSEIKRDFVIIGKKMEENGQTQKYQASGINQNNHPKNKNQLVNFMCEYIGIKRSIK